MQLPFSLAALLEQAWPLILLAVAGGYFMRRGTRRRVQAQIDANTRAATQQGMGYAGPGGGGVDLEEGSHHYDGTTRGLAWTAEVLVLAGQHHVDPDRTPMGRTPYTRWTAPGCVNADGALALMHLPRGVASPRPTAGSAGWVQALQDRAAGVALQAWLRLSFGGERIQGLSLQPAHLQPLPLPQDASAAPLSGGDAAAAAGFEAAYQVLADPVSQVDRLTVPVRAWLMRAHEHRLSVLWDARGLTLFWPSGQATPEKVQACAEFGAELAVRLHARPGGPAP